MKLAFLLFSLFPLFFFSTTITDQLNIKTDSASYDGEVLNLEGKINLSHPVGKLSAKKATLNKKINHETNKLVSSILLENKVSLTLTNGSLLLCEKAFYDIDNQTIDFFNEKNKLRYKGNFLQKNSPPTPFLITSKKAHTEPSKSEEKKDLLFKFFDNVRIKLDNDIFIYGNEAIYANNNILIHPKDSSSFCKVLTKEFKIFSRSLNLNIDNLTLSSEKTFGKIKELLKFSAENLSYYKNENKLELKKKVNLKNKNGTLLCNYLDLFLCNNKIEKARTSPKAKLTLSSEKGKSTFCFYDPMELDLKENILFTISQENPLGILYKDSEVELFAKKATFNLKETATLFSLEKALLEQDIYLISKSLNDSLSFVLADKLTYIPKENLFILESLPGKKVLFVKEDNSLTLSADKIEITRSKNSDENNIKGIGTVRVTLSIEEKSKIENLINNHKKTHE